MRTATLSQPLRLRLSLRDAPEERLMFITLTFRVPSSVVREYVQREEDGLPPRAAVEQQIRKTVTAEWPTITGEEVVRAGA